MYADLLTLCEQLLRLRFKKLRVFVAFAAMVDMCEDRYLLEVCTQVLQGQRFSSDLDSSSALVVNFIPHPPPPGGGGIQGI